MKALKTLWNVTPAVIIGKKMHQANKNRQARKKLQPKKAKVKVLTLSGMYYSSHPDIHGYTTLTLEFGEDNVRVLNKKDVVRTFGWDEIISYENESEDKSQVQTSQRITATRMVAVGVFALAAPKKSKSGNITSKFYDVLHTTSGDIELDVVIDSGGIGGSIGDASRSIATFAINRRTGQTIAVRRFVAEHAKAKVPNQTLSNPVDQIQKLAELKEQGYLTQKEFDLKKKELLGL